MNQNSIYKVNRDAESGKISAEEYANLHAQLASDKLDNKLNDSEAQQDDVNRWLNEQTAGFDDAHMEFIDAASTQKAHYFAELKQISEQHDKKTEFNLNQLQETKQRRDEAIAKHVQEQKNLLSLAIKERNAAQADYQKKLEELKKLQNKYIDLRQKSDEQNIRTGLLREQYRESRQADQEIKKYYGKNDNFDIKTDIEISAPEYALRKARAFAESQKELMDAAALQQDPDVRMRIEFEQIRRESVFRQDQNIKIESLTSQSRSTEIKMHQDNERLAAISALELDMKLEAKGIKVDFSELEPKVREIQSNELLNRSLRENLQKVKADPDLKTKLETEQMQERILQSHVNNTALRMDKKADEVSAAREQVENKTEQVNQRKLTMTERLEENRKLASEKNYAAVMSTSQVSSLEEARRNQLRAAEIAQLQKTQMQTNAQSR